MRTKNKPSIWKSIYSTKMGLRQSPKKRKLHKMSAAYEKGYPKTGFSLII